jgi:hypothetical protein
MRTCSADERESHDINGKSGDAEPPSDFEILIAGPF